MPFPSNPYRTKNLPSFRLGMNTLQDQMEISDFELADSENWDVDEDSLLMSAGYVQWADDADAGPYWGIFQFVKSDGTQVNIRQRQGTLQYNTGEAGSGEWTTCTLPTAGSPAATITLTQYPCTFAQLNDKVLWGNGIDSTMQSTDGITWTIPTYGSPAQELPKSYVFNNGKNRIIFFKQDANRFRIDWSNINDPLTIDAASYALVDPNNGHGVRGMAKTPIGSTLLFTAGALYEVSDYVDNGIVDINLVADNVHLSSHQSIVTTEDSVIFHAYDGIYEYINGAVRKISGRISPTGDNFIIKPHLVCAVYINGTVYMSTPDVSISQDYNTQEWMIHKFLGRNDPLQPYVIMKNQRYFGCYGLMFTDQADEVYLTPIVGDSRPSTLGSPAVTNSLFAFVINYRDVDHENGLDGSAQTSTFTTKFFSEDIPFHVKRFKKAFAQFELENTLTYTLEYRFQPYGEWQSYGATLTPEGSLDFLLEDDSEGGFSEGFSFSQSELGNVAVPIEHSNTSRGIQFRMTVSSILPVRLYGMAFNYYTKPQFR
jgi:hypothetical protein